MKKAFIVTSVVLAIGAGLAYSLYKHQVYEKEPVPAATKITELAAADRTQQTTQKIAALPEELNLQMSFYPQAPFGDWDYPWQEACEEASILLVANEYFHHGWSREDFRDEILKLVEWQNKKFGDYKDTNAEQVAQMLTEYLGLKSVIHADPAYEDVQRMLARGHLVVGLFAGKELGNPFYSNGGPVYHAMVLKGYKAGNKVITADVGTRRGEDYVYTWDKLSSALHEWAVPIDTGKKVVIEILTPFE